MKLKRLTLLMASALAAVGVVSAQSYFDDDIYYNPAKATKQPAKTQKTNSSNQRNTVVVYDYPSADNFTVNGTRKISVDDYNRRGIFASDSLTADTTATDFEYTRRIEQFYNPEIVSNSGDKELANIYYMEPDQVNIYVNTPSSYWGYNYFYPYSAWTFDPFWSNNYWRWNSAWYWNSWYDPFWGPSWTWGPGWGWGSSWAWGPSWGWGPGWGWGSGWGPSWGWGPGWNPGPRRAPDLMAGRQPGVNVANGAHPGSVSRPVYGNNRRPGISTRPGSNTRPSQDYYFNNTRPTINNGNGVNSNRRPGVTTNGSSRPSTNTRPSTNSRPTYDYNNGYNHNNNNNSYTRPSNSNSGGRFGYGSGMGGGSRGTGGGMRGTGGGSRGGRR